AGAAGRPVRHGASQMAGGSTRLAEATARSSGLTVERAGRPSQASAPRCGKLIAGHATMEAGRAPAFADGHGGWRTSERAGRDRGGRDRKSTRLNSSHVKISYAVF